MTVCTACSVSRIAHHSSLAFDSRHLIPSYSSPSLPWSLSSQSPSPQSKPCNPFFYSTPSTSCFCQPPILSPGSSSVSLSPSASTSLSASPSSFVSPPSHSYITLPVISCPSDSELFWTWFLSPLSPEEPASIGSISSFIGEWLIYREGVSAVGSSNCSGMPSLWVIGSHVGWSASLFTKTAWFRSPAWYPKRTKGSSWTLAGGSNTLLLISYRISPCRFYNHLQSHHLCLPRTEPKYRLHKISERSETSSNCSLPKKFRSANKHSTTK